MNIIDEPSTDMDSLPDIINSFEHLTLKELDAVRLLDRMDTKYVFNAKRLPAVLLDIRNDYRILDMNGTRQNCYQTIYYDTNELSMYHSTTMAEPAGIKSGSEDTAIRMSITWK
jgi:hypothetical protein